MKVDFKAVFLTLLPFVIQGIKNAELVHDAPGAEKKALAIQHTVAEALPAVAIVAPDLHTDAIKDLAGHVIDGVFNAMKIAADAKGIKPHVDAAAQGS